MDIAASSYDNGQYSIQNCARILKELRTSRLLAEIYYGYCLELLKDRENRVMIVSSKDCPSLLVSWIKYKYQRANP